MLELLLAALTTIKLFSEHIEYKGKLIVFSLGIVSTLSFYSLLFSSNFYSILLNRLIPLEILAKL